MFLDKLDYYFVFPKLVQVIAPVLDGDVLVWGSDTLDPKDNLCAVLFSSSKLTKPLLLNS